MDQAASEQCSKLLYEHFLPSSSGPRHGTGSLSLVISGLTHTLLGFSVLPSPV